MVCEDEGGLSVLRTHYSDWAPCPGPAQKLLIPATSTSKSKGCEACNVLSQAHCNSSVLSRRQVLMIDG